MTTDAGAGGGGRSPGLSLPLDRSTAWRHGSGHVYRRESNPTVVAVEEELGALDGGHALLFPSGMAAATALLLAFLGPGDAVAFPHGAYYGFALLVREDLGRWGLQLVEFDQTGPAPEGVAAVWLEAPSNPLLSFPDIEAHAVSARARGQLLVVDATVATPALLRPLAHGADVVVHSATKGLGGHSDLLAGVATLADGERARSLTRLRTRSGLVCSPDEAWLLARGLKTLPLRIRRQSQTALELARRLGRRPEVEAVRYPGLGDPVAARYLSGGFGGLLSFDLAGGATAAEAFERSTRLIANATSLGGAGSTIESRRRHEGERVPAGLLRLSVGLEEVDDLWDDITGAFGSTA